eukprot:3888976-Pyramimonas_sp.AAC.1
MLQLKTLKLKTLKLNTRFPPRCRMQDAVTGTCGKAATARAFGLGHTTWAALGCRVYRECAATQPGLEGIRVLGFEGVNRLADLGHDPVEVEQCAVLVVKVAALIVIVPPAGAPVAVDGQEGAVTVQLVDNQNVPGGVVLPGGDRDVFLEFLLPPAASGADR